MHLPGSANTAGVFLGFGQAEAAMGSKPSCLTALSG
jgi:hypothetical protein